MRELIIPKFNNNDATCVLAQWMHGDGEVVPVDSVVAEIETSKAIEELPADQDGILHRLVPENAECAFGQAIGWLFDSEQERQQHLARLEEERPAEAEAGSGGPVLTDAARELAARHGIGADRLRDVGKRVLRVSDIEQLVAREHGAAGTVTELSRRQQSIAAVVSESHRTIPAALAAIRVDLSALEAALRARSARGHPPLGVPEVLIRAVARQHDSFPLFFGHLGAGATVRVPEHADVGVTIDVGTGLFIPVLRGPAQLNLSELGGQLMDFRIKALRQAFREDELGGASITISLHNDPDIVFAAPIVHPGQTCVVTLCSTQHEVRLDGDGAPVTRPYATVVASYDHRVINGSAAVRFLRDVKRSLEDPAVLTEPED